MEKTLYHVDEGYFLPKDDPDYEAYSSVYDKKQGYYDTDQFETFDFEKAKTLNDYNDDSLDNFFVIVMDTGSFDDEDENFASDENGLLEYWDCNGVDYDVKNIVWYKAKKDGKPVVIEGAPVPNALIA